jgi:hypothetical protein
MVLKEGLFFVLAPFVTAYDAIALAEHVFHINGSRCRLRPKNPRVLKGIWWRCRDLNPGHSGYEPLALTN